MTLLLLYANADWALIKHRTVNKHIVNELGRIGYLVHELYQAGKLRLSDARLGTIDPEPFRAFIDNIKDTNQQSKPAATGETKHLIYLQMESVDGVSIQSSYKGKPLMPFLHRLREKSIYFTNQLDNSDAGRTTDGEFLVLTSLPTIRNEPTYVNYDLSYTPSLPKTLNAVGYRTISIHGFDSNFWNRRQAHLQLGFQESYFRDQLDDSDTIGWGISDTSVLQQTAKLISQSDRPVFAHVILLTNHHPYHHVGEKLGAVKPSIELNLVDSLAYVDRSIQRFFDNLESDGILDDCIIAIFSDHDSGAETALRSIVEIENHTFRDTLPMLIYGTEGGPQRIEKATGHQDLPVIVLQELGIDTPDTFTGNSLLSNLPTYHPKKGKRIIKDGKLIESEPDIDLNKLTKLAILHPERLSAK